MTRLPLSATPPAGDDRAPGRGFWPIRDIPSLFWLVLLVAAILAQGVLPAPRWLLVHLLLLGAATHAILTWSQYFSFALLHATLTRDERRRQSIRLWLANLGAAAVLAGVVLAVWPVTVAGAAALVVAVVWHGASLVRRLRTSLPGRFGGAVRYYIVAAAILPVGAGIGVWIARDGGAPGLALAHALMNVLGWIGLTVAGTLITLWPTMLGTRIDEAAPAGAARALPMLSLGVLVAATGAAFQQTVVLSVGLIGYIAGLGIIALSLWRAAQQRLPRHFAPLSVGAGLGWWIAGLIALLVTMLAAGEEGIGGVQAAIEAILPLLVAGFVAQVLIGALSHLVPVALAGGPAAVRAGSATFDAMGPLRVSVANASLLVAALPVAEPVRNAVTMLFLLAVCSFLPLMVVAIRRQSAAKRARAGASPAPDAAGSREPADEHVRSGRRAGQAVAGLLAVVLVTASCTALGGGTGGGSPTDVDAPVQSVQVRAVGMHFVPGTIEVPKGTRLEIEVVNDDPSLLHDLMVPNRAATARLYPGQSETIDAGVVTDDIEAYCTVTGHRQMGMVLSIVAVEP